VILFSPQLGVLKFIERLNSSVPSSSSCKDRRSFRVAADPTEWLGLKIAPWPTVLSSVPSSTTSSTITTTTTNPENQL
jgi:hypothetical protein